MRLLNSKTLKLAEFSGDTPPKYAVLSHRWGDEEVSFQEMRDPKPRTKPKNGYNKIKNCAEKAAANGLEWVSEFLGGYGSVRDVAFGFDKFIPRSLFKVSGDIIHRYYDWK